MRKLAALVVILTAACGAPLSATFNGASPQPMNLTLKCALVTADSLGYKARMINHDKGMEAIRKDSATASFEDGRQEKINATARDSKSNDGSSSFTVVAATFSLHWTRIGLESQEIPASDKVKADAKTVATKCGGEMK